MTKFTVNGKEYKAKAIDFNTVCELEDLGLSFENMMKKPMITSRAYFSVCSGLSQEMAGKEMEKHIVGGGNLNEIMEVFIKEMTNSDFFQNLSKNA